MLWMYQRVFYGAVNNPANTALPDLSARESIALWPTAVMAVIMGVASPLWIRPMEVAVQQTIPPVTATASVGSPSSHSNTGGGGR